MKERQLGLLPLVLKASLVVMLGFFFPIVYVLLPVFFLTEAVAQGLGKVLLCFLALCGVLALLSPLLGLGVLTLFGPLLLILHYGFVSRASWDRNVLFGTVVVFLSMMVLLISRGAISHLQDPEFPAQIAKLQEQALIQVGMQGESLQSYVEALPRLLSEMIGLLPALLLIASLVLSYATCALAVRSLRSRGIHVGFPGSLSSLRLPEGLFLVLFLVLGITMLFPRAVAPVESLLMENGQLLVGFLFFVGGLGFTSYLLERWKMPSFVRNVFLVAMVVLPFFRGFLLTVGLIDYALNIRRLGH